MPIDKLDPFQEFLRLRNIFNELFERSFREQLLSDEVGQDHWVPIADVYETKNELVIQAEIPGVDREDIEIELDSNRLTIRGEHSRSNEEGQPVYHRMERHNGPFKLSVNLQQVTADPEKIKASYEKGVLTVVLSLDASKSTKKIKIKTEC